MCEDYLEAVYVEGHERINKIYELNTHHPFVKQFREKCPRSGSRTITDFHVQSVIVRDPLRRLNPLV